jgi:hypothetical protein
MHQNQKEQEVACVKPGNVGTSVFLEDVPDRHAWIVAHIFDNVVRAPETVKYSPEMK